jgi:single-strand DNA-binding protein
MAAGDTNITMIGNLVNDPELRFTPSGAAVAKFTVASTPRYLDKATNEWKDGDSLFLQCQIWRQAAENVAESLTRGMRVIVSGRLKQRSYETKEGEKRTVFEVEVDEVGPSLRNATAKVTKTTRPAGGAGGSYSAPADASSAEDPWSLRHQARVPVDSLPLLKVHRQMILGQLHQLVAVGQRQLQMISLRSSTETI